jgi:hypothetical protein
MSHELAGLLDATPIWLIGVLVLGAMLLAAWAGRALAYLRGDPDEKRPDVESHIVSAIMGLLALLVGFTFSIAMDRYDTRRVLVLEESNAIGTAYLRTQLLEQPYRDEISGVLKAYTDNRVALSEAPRNRRAPLVLENDRLITELWRGVVAVHPRIQTLEAAGPFIESVNLVIDMDASRKVARDAHVPALVFLLLFVYQIASAGVLGYALSGSRSIFLAAMLFALFTLALVLTIDIDRAVGGAVRESQQPMKTLQKQLAEQPPSTYDPQPQSDTP